MHVVDAAMRWFDDACEKAMSAGSTCFQWDSSIGGASFCSSLGFKSEDWESYWFVDWTSPLSWCLLLFWSIKSVCASDPHVMACNDSFPSWKHVWDDANGLWFYMVGFLAWGLNTCGRCGICFIALIWWCMWKDDVSWSHLFSVGLKCRRSPSLPSILLELIRV